MYVCTLTSAIYLHYSNDDCTRADAVFLADMGDDRQIPYNAVESVHDTIKLVIVINTELPAKYCASKKINHLLHLIHELQDYD